MKRHHHVPFNAALLALLALPLSLATTAGQAAETSATYACESGNSLTVHRDDSKPSITIDYLDRAFVLFPFGNEGRFSSEAGLSPDRGLQFASDGTTATLSEMIMDHTAPGPTVIETCTIDASGAAALPAEGSLPVGTWTLTTLNGAPGAVGVDTRITFGADGSVGGNGGCNTFGGAATVTATGISIPNVFSTMMMCEGDQSTQEHGFLSAIEQTASFKVDGETLSLFDAAGKELAVLAAEVAADTALPVGTWKLSTIAGLPSAADVETRLTIEADGSVHGNGGCNNVGGQAILTEAGLSIPNMFATMMMCEDAKNAQEHAFLAAVDATAKHRIIEGKLFFYDEADKELLGFTAAP